MQVQTQRRLCYFSAENIQLGISQLQAEIENGLNYVGYDSEFSQQKDGKQILSLIQIASRDTAYLFHVHGMNFFPEGLSRILKNDKVVKIGFGLQQDIIVLYNTFRVQVNFLDLQLILFIINQKSFSLKEAVEKYCGKILPKTHSGTHWQWGGELDETKKRYAADDAFACIDLWHIVGMNIPNLKMIPKIVSPQPPREIITKSMADIEETEYERAIEWLQRFPPTTGPKETQNKLINSYGPWQCYTTKEREAMSIVVTDRLFKSSNGNSPPIVIIVEKKKDSPRLENINEKDIVNVKRFMKSMWFGEPRQKEKLVNQVANSCNTISFFTKGMHEKREEISALIDVLVSRGEIELNKGFLSYKILN